MPPKKLQLKLNFRTMRERGEGKVGKKAHGESERSQAQDKLPVINYSRGEGHFKTAFESRKGGRGRIMTRKNVGFNKK